MGDDMDGILQTPGEPPTSVNCNLQGEGGVRGVDTCPQHEHNNHPPYPTTTHHKHYYPIHLFKQTHQDLIHMEQTKTHCSPQVLRIRNQTARSKKLNFKDNKKQPSGTTKKKPVKRYL
ncbi:unnamed protein product [Ambrosiozyma monospora]|uniref:Unnamed protein product n=1 Tax=Ambrosiozyma monospora TaxID=43982 RepID=A0ACB5T546_AMBMO|nr:unnamed protein product [Ambrosiozyma monospora]